MTALLVLWNEAMKAKAKEWIDKAPKDTRITFKGPKRTIPQNDRLWVLLTIVADNLVWHGQKYTPEEWKDYFMHALRGEKWMPFEDGGMIPIGRSTSALSKEEHGDLQTLIEAFCARQGIDIGEPDK